MLSKSRLRSIISRCTYVNTTQNRMFYLMTRSLTQHTLLWLYRSQTYFKDQTDSQTGNPLLPPFWLLFLIIARAILHTALRGQDNTYHDISYTSHGALVLMGKIPMIGRLRRSIPSTSSKLSIN